MTVAVANTSNTSTFQYWLNRTNELADAMSTKAITVESNTATGNCHVNGIFSSVTLGANTIRGGNVTTTATVTFSSNLQIASGNTLTIGNSSINVFANSSYISIANSTQNTQLSINQLTIGNTTVNSTVINVQSITVDTITITNSTSQQYQYQINVQTVGTSVQLLDSIQSNTYQGAEYVITIKDNNANSYQISKLLLVGTGDDSYITEFGVVLSNSQLGQFQANANATHYTLYITPQSTNTYVRGIKTVVSI